MEPSKNFFFCTHTRGAQSAPSLAPPRAHTQIPHTHHATETETETEAETETETETATATETEPETETEANTQTHTETQTEATELLKASSSEKWANGQVSLDVPSTPAHFLRGLKLLKKKEPAEKSAPLLLRSSSSEKGTIEVSPTAAYAMRLVSAVACFSSMAGELYFML